MYFVSYIIYYYRPILYVRIVHTSQCFTRYSYSSVFIIINNNAEAFLFRKGPHHQSMYVLLLLYHNGRMVSVKCALSLSLCVSLCAR